MFARSCDWITLLPLRKNHSAFHFQFCWFLSSMSLIVLDVELTEKDTIKELRLYIYGSLQGFSFCPKKTCKLNKQTTWNKRHLHGIARSSGQLDYYKHFAVFCDIKVMNAEVFAKGLEKCRLLTRLVGQNLESLDDYCCQKLHDLVRTDSSWICSSLPFRHKTRQASLCRKESKGAWRMGYATIVIFCTWIFYLC